MSAGRSRRAVLGAVVAAVGVAAVPGVALGAPVRGRGRGHRDGALPTASLLLAADQASERVLLLDPGDSSWSAQAGPQRRSARQAALWSWSAADDSTLDDLEPDQSWRLVSEAKYRVGGGRRWVLTCASRGLAAVVPYPVGVSRWAAAVEGNAHSLELLPNGNVAVSASEGGFVRVYAASQGPRAARFAQFDLFSAHGLQWDPVRNLLWAVGFSQLVALEVGGTPADPRLTVVRAVDLPDPDLDGHDLSLVAADPGRLWVTTADHVYQYRIADGVFASYQGQPDIDGAGVKSVGDDPVTGQVLTVAPAADNPCAWCTSTVGFHRPTGSERIDGSSLYKARWMPRTPADWWITDTPQRTDRNR